MSGNYERAKSLEKLAERRIFVPAYMARGGAFCYLLQIPRNVPASRGILFLQSFKKHASELCPLWALFPISKVRNLFEITNI